MLDEKYYILDNAWQYYVILKCTKQKVDDYVSYGYKRCISDEVAITCSRPPSGLSGII